MAGNKETFLILLCSILFVVVPLAHGWGKEGHYIICRIAQGRLGEKAAAAVNDLLPDYAQNDLASLCLWADHMKFILRWSAPLHYIDTPDSLCNFAYRRDCKNAEGEENMCVAGGIQNYTRQLETYSDSSLRSQYNLTQALLFLSHFVGDVHQPLHVGFTTDRGGNAIDVKWFTTKTVLHHVWDTSMIETAMERFYDSDLESLIGAIQRNITGVWAGRIDGWEKCSRGEVACPNGYILIYNKSLDF
ncbi:unnamed protein product [Victoria cruziana]